MATELGRPLAEGLPHGIGEIRGKSPPEVAAASAFAGVEARAALPLHGAEAPAAKALDGVLLSHILSVG